MKNTRKSKDKFTIFEDPTNPKLIDEIVAKWKEDELDPFEWGNHVRV